jgi:predicted CoA-binding protein
LDGTLVAVDASGQPNAFGVRVYRELQGVPAPADLADVVTTDDTLEAIDRTVIATAER